MAEQTFTLYAKFTIVAPKAGQDRASAERALGEIVAGFVGCDIDDGAGPDSLNVIAAGLVPAPVTLRRCEGCGEIIDPEGEHVNLFGATYHVSCA